MSIFPTSIGSGSKNPWTKEQDLVLFTMTCEGKGRREIAAATNHPENSITYRVGVLRKAEDKAKKDGIVIGSIEDLLKLIKY